MPAKQIISSPNAPSAIGAYSPAVRFGDLIFTAGQIGVNPTDRKLVEGGVEAETRQALTNIKHLLEAAGSGLDNVLKTTVFLKDIADFGKFNAVYGEFFTAGSAPARSTIQAGALPAGASVEIEAVAFVGPGGND